MKKIKFSKRISNISPAISQNLISKVRELKRLGNKIHDFSKQLETPKVAIKYAIESLKTPEGSLISDIRGNYLLRKTIAQKCLYNNNLKINAEENIIVTVGAKEGILSTLFALLDHNDEAIVEDPGYLSFEPQIKLVGAKPILLPLDKQDGFKFSIEHLINKITSKTKLLILCNPHNPTGRCFSRDELIKIGKICIDNNIYLLIDEAYEHFVYDGLKHHSMASLPKMFERTITIQTVSKIFNMSGWRIGWVIGPAEIINKILIAHSHSVTAPSTFAQEGAIPVIEKNIGEGGMKIPKIVDRYERQRDLMVSLLKSIEGVECHLPEGTFFAFPNISNFGYGSFEISNYLLEEAGVATVPGLAFGPSGDSFLRLVFKEDKKSIKMGINQMNLALEKLRKKQLSNKKQPYEL